MRHRVISVLPLSHMRSPHEIPRLRFSGMRLAFGWTITFAHGYLNCAPVGWIAVDSIRYEP